MTVVRVGGDVEVLLVRCRTGRVLEFEAQPANYTTDLFLGTLVVQIDQSLEVLLVVQVVGPAIGTESGDIQVVVNLLEDGNAALFMDLPLLCCQSDGAGRLIVLMQRFL